MVCITPNVTLGVTIGAMAIGSWFTFAGARSPHQRVVKVPSALLFPDASGRCLHDVVLTQVFAESANAMSQLISL